MAAVTVHRDFGTQKIKSVTVSTLPDLFAMKWLDATKWFQRNLYAGQEATVRTGQETTDWFQIRKGVCQDCILSSCLFNLYGEYIMRNAGLDEAQAGGKIARRNINNRRYANDTTLKAESEEQKNLWMKVNEKSGKVGLNSAFHKLTSWHLAPSFHGE